jgi:hypothetical protein
VPANKLPEGLLVDGWASVGFGMDIILPSPRTAREVLEAHGGKAARGHAEALCCAISLHPADTSVLPMSVS